MAEVISFDDLVESPGARAGVLSFDDLTDDVLPGRGTGGEGEGEWEYLSTDAPPALEESIIRTMRARSGRQDAGGPRVVSFEDLEESGAPRSEMSLSDAGAEAHWIERMPAEALGWLREKLTPLIGESEREKARARGQLGLLLDASEEQVIEAAPSRRFAERGLLRGILNAEPIGGGLPKVTADDLVSGPAGAVGPAKIIAGGLRAAANLGDFFLTPLGAATLGTGGLPVAAQRAIAGLFWGDMARHAPEQYAALKDAVKRDDLQGVTEHGLGALATLVFTSALAKHAVLGPKPVEGAGVKAGEELNATDATDAKVGGEGSLTTEAQRHGEEGKGFKPEELPPKKETKGEDVVSEEMARALDEADKVVSFDDLVEEAAPARERLPGEDWDAAPGKEELKGSKAEFERGEDVVDWLMDRRIKIKPEVAGDLVELSELARKSEKGVFDLEGTPLDTVVEGYRRETKKEVTPEEFLEMIEGVKGSREREQERFTQEIGARAQDANWQLMAVEGQRKKAGKVEVVGAEELGAGDEFTVDGEPVVVQRVKTRAGDETMVENVTVKDGPKMGVQVVGGEQALRIDAGSLRREGGGGPGAVEAWADRVIEDARGRVSSGLDPELLAAYAVKGAFVLGRGVRDAGEWAAEMVRQYGEGIREHLPAIRKRAEEILATGLQGPDKPAELPAGVGERQFPKQVDISADVSNDVKLRQGPRLYERRGNVTDAELANQIIQGQGLEPAGRMFLDEAVEMPASVRTALGLELVKRWGMEEQMAALTKDKAREEAALQAQVDLVQAVTERSTETAQGLQAMGMWGRLTPEGQLLNAQRVIDGARVKKLGALRPGLENMRRTVEEVNQQTAGEVAVDETVTRAGTDAIAGTPIVKATTAAEITRQVARDLTKGSTLAGLAKEKGEAIQEVAAGHFRGEDPARPLWRKLWDKFKMPTEEAKRLADRLQKEFGKAVEKEMARAAKQAKKEAERALERERALRQGDDGLWAQYKQAAAEKLAAAVRGLSPGKPKGALQEFAGRLTSQLRAELVRRLPKRAKAVAALSEEQVLREAALNAEKYQEAWRSAQKMMQEEFKNEPKILEQLDQAMGLVSPNLFSSRAVDVLLRRQMEAQGVVLRNLVKEHYTKTETTRRSLADKIVERVGIDGEKARALSRMIEGKFNERATGAKRAALKRLSVPGRIGRGMAKGLHEKLIEWSNLGAMDTPGFERVIGEKLKLPTFTPEMAREVKRRAMEIQNAKEGFQRQRKVIELMNYLARQKGISASEMGWAFWFANALSGPATHAVNAGANAGNMAGNFAFTLARQKGRGLPGLVAATARGFGKGAREAGEILKTGVVSGTRLQKPEALRALELADFRGAAAPLKLWRYVGRAMGAADMVFYKGAEEMRSHTLAREIGRREGLTGEKLQKRVEEVMGDGEGRLEAAKAQADAEGLTGSDWRRRVDELLEMERPAELRENARDFGLRATFNQKPYGVLGKIAQALNQLKGEYPAVNVVAPFTNIVSNVLNESLNYFPVTGGYRAYRGWKSGELEGRPRREGELFDQTAKAVTGTALLTSVALMASENLDDPDPDFMVTGSGPRSKEQRDQLRETGWIPYSVKVGDKYYAYQNTPMGFGLAVLGNYLDAVRYKGLDKTDALNRAAYAMRMGGKVFMEQSFLSGMADMVTTLERDSTKTSGEQAGRGLFRTASTFVVPNALKWVDQVFDPTVYDARSVEGQLAASVPFVRRLNSPALNALGQPVRKFAGDRFVSGERGDPVWDLLSRKQAWVSVPDREVIIGDKSRGPDNYRRLNDGEFYLYVRESGRGIRERLLDRMDAIRDAEPDKARAMVEKIVVEERAKARRGF